MCQLLPFERVSSKAENTHHRQLFFHRPDVARILARLHKTPEWKCLRYTEAGGKVLDSIRTLSAATGWMSPRAGRYVVADDCCHTFENLNRMWPPGYSQGNPWNMLREFNRMKDVAGADLARLIPGHDIKLFSRYPSGEREGMRFAEVCLAGQHTSLPVRTSLEPQAR